MTHDNHFPCRRFNQTDLFMRPFFFTTTTRTIGHNISFYRWLRPRRLALAADAYPSGLAEGGNSFSGRIKRKIILGTAHYARHLMVFFVPRPVPHSGFGTFFSPAAIRRFEYGFPEVDAAGFWNGNSRRFLVLHAAFFVPGVHPLPAGLSIPPLSLPGRGRPGPGREQSLLVASGLFCLSSLMNAVRLSSPHNSSPRSWHTLEWRMPLTCWSWFVTSILISSRFS